MICIDPKGENARVTGRTRGLKGDVWCLDPFGVSGRPAARYNPLAWLDAASPDIAEDAQTIADIILHTVIREPLPLRRWRRCATS